MCGEKEEIDLYTHSHTHSLKHTHYFVAWGEFERSAERERYIIYRIYIIMMKNWLLKKTLCFS